MDPFLIWSTCKVPTEMENWPYNLIMPLPPVEWIHYEAGQDCQNSPQYHPSSRNPLSTLLLNLWSTPIGPNMQSPREILHNRFQECPDQLPQPINTESVQNYFISKNIDPKDYYNRAHNVQPLPELNPGQEELFLLLTKHNACIPSTITAQASTLEVYHWSMTAHLTLPTRDTPDCRYRTILRSILWAFTSKDTELHTDSSMKQCPSAEQHPSVKQYP